MAIEYDAAKDAQNRAKHGLRLVFGARVIATARVTLIDGRFGYGEKRRVAYGWIDGKLYCCVHTIRENTYRIISVRRANRREERRYGRGEAGSDDVGRSPGSSGPDG